MSASGDHALTDHEVAVGAGIAHLLEHMTFKGTETRTARELAEVVDRVGGQINAYTSKEDTSFYIRVLDEHFGLAMEVLADMTRSRLLGWTGYVSTERALLGLIDRYRAERLVP